MPPSSAMSMQRSKEFMDQANFDMLVFHFKEIKEKEQSIFIAKCNTFKEVLLQLSLTCQGKQRFTSDDL